MKRHMAVFLLALLVVGVLMVYTVAFQIESTEAALINRFGRTVRSLDGATQAGLHFKWPYPVERLVKYDTRVRVFEDVHGEVQTHDKQNVLVSVYCAWRIEEPVKFHRVLEYVDEAQARLRKLIETYKNAVISRRDMSELINTDPEAMRLVEIEAEILALIRAEASDKYGIEVVGVGIRDLGLSESVSEAVIEAMKAERLRYVRRYQAEGEAQATAIRERAKSDRDQIIAFASRQAQNIRSEGDRAAAEYYARFEENPGLSMFLRAMESLRKELSSRTVFLLDGSEIPAVKFFREGPSLDVRSDAAKAATDE